MPSQRNEEIVAEDVRKKYLNSPLLQLWRFQIVVHWQCHTDYLFFKRNCSVADPDIGVTDCVPKLQHAWQRQNERVRLWKCPKLYLGWQRQKKRGYLWQFLPLWYHQLNVGQEMKVVTLNPNHLHHLMYFQYGFVAYYSYRVFLYRRCSHFKIFNIILMSFTNFFCLQLV